MISIGTNYYLQRKKPTIHETVHIGKQSWGWLMHWDSCDEGMWPRWCDEDHSLNESGEYPSLPHSIHSVEDIRSYLRTGEWELVNEYGEAFDDPLAKIDDLCAWDGGKSGYNDRHPDKPVTWDVHVPSGYRDAEGQIFDRGDGFI